MRHITRHSPIFILFYRRRYFPAHISPKVRMRAGGVWNSYVFHLLITSDPVRMSQPCAVRGEIPSGRGIWGHSSAGRAPALSRASRMSPVRFRLSPPPLLPGAYPSLCRTVATNTARHISRCSSMAEHQPSKLAVRVRFPLSAPPALVPQDSFLCSNWWSCAVTGNAAQQIRRYRLHEDGVDPASGKPDNLQNTPEEGVYNPSDLHEVRTGFFKRRRLNDA